MKWVFRLGIDKKIHPFLRDAHISISGHIGLVWQHCIGCRKKTNGNSTAPTAVYTSWGRVCCWINGDWWSNEYPSSKLICLASYPMLQLAWVWLTGIRPKWRQALNHSSHDVHVLSDNEHACWTCASLLVFTVSKHMFIGRWRHAVLHARFVLINCANLLLTLQNTSPLKTLGASHWASLNLIYYFYQVLMYAMCSTTLAD